jgi:NADH-ubiquinone oxidoreductase chain 5
MAIAAPTPVSALVHSSTLVTAGVYLMIRFNRFLLAGGIRMYLFYLSVLTMMIAGVIANVENDLKKIIALSTLSQLGLIIIILRLGFGIISFYHLLTHAIFKSILFICAGIIIHLIMNNQDIRLLGNINEIVPYTIIRFYVSNLALCGIPFISGFYSKDLIIEIIYNLRINIFMLVLAVISLIFTVSYSFRLFYYLFFNDLKFYSYSNFKENKIINLSIIRLIFIRVLMGSLLNWIFFYNLYIIYLGLKIKIITLAVCIIGIFLGYILRRTDYIYKFYNLLYFFRSI